MLNNESAMITDEDIDQFQFDVVCRLVSKDGEIMVNGDAIPIPKMVWKKVIDEESTMVFNMYNMCECCDRHQTNRPISLNNGWKNTPLRKHLRPECIEDPTKCQCSCRHTARKMAHQFNAE